MTVKIPNCIICSKKRFKKLYAINNYSIVKCLNCSFVFIAPLPGKKELDIFYKKFKFSDGFVFEKLLRIDARRSLSNLNAMGIKKGSILDVGCGAGFFIDEARKQKWNVKGIDTAKSPIVYASKKLKLPAEQKDILKHKTSETYDVISLQQVIEHLVDPYLVLEKINKLLKKDGILCVSTPNIESWLSIVLKERFNYLIPPEHILYFSPKTLEVLLEKAGFKVIRTTTYGYPMDFGGIYRALREPKSELRKVTHKINTKNQNQNKKTEKSIKNKFFEDTLCQYLHPLLNIFNKGSMVEIYARKI